MSFRSRPTIHGHPHPAQAKRVDGEGCASPATAVLAFVFLAAAIASAQTTTTTTTKTVTTYSSHTSSSSQSVPNQPPAPIERPSASQPSGQQGTATVPANTGSRVTPYDAQQALAFHNAKRRDVAAPPLAWSADLAAVAQKWADHLATEQSCDLVHTTGDRFGENLFGGSGRAYTALDAAQDWYGEIAKFHYGQLSDNNWYASGHYTQMVWRDTQRVGMGRATCSSGRVVIVAEYDPPGNYMGQKPY